MQRGAVVDELQTLAKSEFLHVPDDVRTPARSELQVCARAEKAYGRIHLLLEAGERFHLFLVEDLVDLEAPRPTLEPTDDAQVTQGLCLRLHPNPPAVQALPARWRTSP